MYIIDMSYRYSITEARSHLPTIVDQAESGVEVQLTRRGKPVAVVVGLRVFERLRGDRPQFASAYREFLERYALNDVGLDGDVFTRSRAKDVGRKVSL